MDHFEVNLFPMKIQLERGGGQAAVRVHLPRYRRGRRGRSRQERLALHAQAKHGRPGRGRGRRRVDGELDGPRGRRAAQLDQHPAGLARAPAPSDAHVALEPERVESEEGGQRAQRRGATRSDCSGRRPRRGRRPRSRRTSRSGRRTRRGPARWGGRRRDSRPRTATGRARRRRASPRRCRGSRCGTSPTPTTSSSRRTT